LRTKLSIHSSYGQGKSGNFKKSGKVRKSWEKIKRSGKVGEFYISKSGENKGVKESQGKSKYRVQKLTKMQKKV